MTTFTVVYRIGGTESCEWNSSIPVATMPEAVAQKDEVERGGRKALIFRTSQLASIGMPEGWDWPNDPQATRYVEECLPFAS